MAQQEGTQRSISNLTFRLSHYMVELWVLIFAGYHLSVALRVGFKLHEPRIFQVELSYLLFVFFVDLGRFSVATEGVAYFL